jgi:hypothetical protein
VSPRFGDAAATSVATLPHSGHGNATDAG